MQFMQAMRPEVGVYVPYTQPVQPQLGQLLIVALSERVPLGHAVHVGHGVQVPALVFPHPVL